MAEELSEQEKVKKLKDEVEAAISTVAVAGVSYKIGSRSIQRSSISELKKLRSELQAEEASQGSGEFLGRTYVATFEGR